ncbi:MAG: TerB family tellurite resistance protein [Sulfuritalea sp.]|nr:TerB family tellurite resistance protein [Polynucleobacter sp.]MCF8189329.1 TerB family tellurite resistance protein [Sulfuritalea sp.]
MGLFDMFKGSPPELTPKLTLAVALLHMIHADGEVEAEEIGQVLQALGNDKALFENAGKYAKSNDVDAFLAESAKLLNDDQKLCVLLNLLDSLMADGVAAPQEQSLFSRFMSAYGVSEQTLQPYALGVSVKNNRKVLE